MIGEILPYLIYYTILWFLLHSSFVRFVRVVGFVRVFRPEQSCTHTLINY